MRRLLEHRLCPALGIAATLAGCGAKSGLSFDTGAGAADAGTERSVPGDAAPKGRPEGGAGAPTIDASSPFDAPTSVDAEPPPVDARRGVVTGVWVGPIWIGDNQHTFTLVLHERASGEVIGYVAGGTRFRTARLGRTENARVEFRLQLQDPNLLREIVVSGDISGDTLLGVSDDSSGPRPIRWHRVDQPLRESRLLLYQRTTSQVVEMVLVMDGAALVSGGYVDRSSCDLISCGGIVTSLEHSSAGGSWTESVGIESTGACGRGSVRWTGGGVTGAPTPMLGDFQFVTCDGAETTGPLSVVSESGASTHDITSMLATVGQLADDLEHGGPFTLPYAPFSPDYLHDGIYLGQRLAELNREVVSHGAIRVELAHFRGAATGRSPYPLGPMTNDPAGLDFFERRTSASGEVYREVDSAESDEFRVMSQPSSGGWVISGNQSR